MKQMASAVEIKVHSTSGRVLRSGTVSASTVVSLEKCTICRQRLAELHRFHPEGGVGLEQLSKDQAVNIDLGEEQESLQYKLTDFAVYDKVNEGERHLVPIFAESLLSAKKELWVSGKVVRIDQEDEEDGLRVADLGPITQWTNVTGIEGGENNVILSMEYKGVDVEFNLVRPHKKYMPLYKNIFRMVFMANRIIMRLIECADRGGSMEYSELLEFLDSLNAPQLFEEKLPEVDEEFLQLHSDFIVSQVRHHCYYHRHRRHHHCNFHHHRHHNHRGHHHHLSQHQHDCNSGSKLGGGRGGGVGVLDCGDAMHQGNKYTLFSADDGKSF